MRLLVVEHEPRLLRSLAKALREEGYAVDTADTGTEGLFKAENYTYDAVLLDVMLPELDGSEMLARLRRTRQTAVLMLGARDAGAGDHLVKPFDLPELLARLRALIRRAASQAQAAIEVGDIVVDTRSRTLTRAGEPVALTAREFSILEYLALHRGQVVSHSELCEQLLDETGGTLSDPVDVHVAGIRRKLGYGLIVTRRGQGYSIE